MKALIISKELIKNVLEKTENLPDDFTFDVIDNYIIFADDGECMFEVNIYEFAHLNLKQWAFKQGYELFSRILSNDHQHIGNCVVYRVEADPEESLKIMNEKTEIEAIIKACNWILEQNKINKDR